MARNGKNINVTWKKMNVTGKKMNGTYRARFPKFWSFFLR